MTKPRGHNTTADQLRSIVERLEKLEEEKAAIAIDAGERQKQEAILETYMAHLGMLPLFERKEDAA